MPELTGENRNKKGQFVKGESGNPDGRPAGSISVVAELKKQLGKCPEGQDKKTYLELLVKKMLKKSIVDGDVSMIKDIVNRVDGMPLQKTDLTSDGKELQPLLVKFIDAKDNKHSNGVQEAI